jgi:hypothetical protein
MCLQGPIAILDSPGIVVVLVALDKSLYTDAKVNGSMRALRIEGDIQQALRREANVRVNRE